MTAPRKTASQEIETKYDQIEKLMWDLDFRNCDRRICTKIWEGELGDFNELMFFSFYNTGKITSSESICRIARMIRKKHGWKLDKSKEENKVKDLIYSNNLFEPVPEKQNAEK